jgi:hypothetical protein
MLVGVELPPLFILVLVALVLVFELVSILLLVGIMEDGLWTRLWPMQRDC